MELGFQVNAGPLSQISMQIVSLDTAIQLATGAYGWWKAKARTGTLIQLCALRKGQLVSSSAFQRDVYVERRQRHTIVGSVAQDGRLHRVLMPRASTAISNHPGETCLRALTTALLCFYTVDATHAILKAVIPACLIQPDHDSNGLTHETDFVIDGPLEYSLKATVQSIATEENSDTLRKRLLEVAAEAEDNCFHNAGSSRIRQNIAYAESDAGLAVGMVKWATTSYLKRQYSTYVTKSLNVLALAAVMKYVGFQINPSAQLICSDEDAALFCPDALKKENPWGQVVLNISDTGETDIYKIPSPMMRRGIESAAAASIIPIASIPNLAYRHARQSKYASTQELTDVFLFAFRETNILKSDIVLSRNTVRLDLKVPQRAPNHFHGQLLSRWSPHVTKIILSFMSQYVPVRADPDVWNLDSIHEAFDLCMEAKQNGGDHFTTFASYDSPTLASFSTLHSLILGTAYGIIWHFVKSGGSRVPELSPIVFSPSIMSVQSLHQIIYTLGNVLTGNSPVNHIVGLLSILLLGRATSFAGQNSIVKCLVPENRSLILGVQGNGMHLISRYALRPSLNAVELCYFHIAEGQILNLPLTQEHYVALHEDNWPCEPIRPDRPAKSKVQPFEVHPVWTQGSYRLDLEPLWEQDPRKAVFRLRHNGVEQFPLNPALLEDRLFGIDLRACDHDAASPPPQNEHLWKKLPLNTVFDDAVQTSPATRTWVREIGSRDTVMVDASRSTALQVAILGKIKSDMLAVHVVCERCTYSTFRLMDTPEHRGQSLLLVLGSPPLLPPR